MKSTRKMVIKALLAVGALVLVICGIKAMQIVTMVTTKAPMPVATVTSAPVKEEDWAPMLSAVGAVSAVQGAMVSTELAGTVSEIMFQNGGVAKKGDVILKLDASQEEALLRSAEAEAELARTDLERTRGLASQNVVSKAELDAAESKFRRLTAVVDLDEHSRAQRMIRILQRGLQRHISRHRVHGGIDRRQFADELALRERIGAHTRFQSGRKVLEMLLR